MRQLSLFTPAQVAGMRDRTASRNYSPGRDQFRREHERHRAWGLARRHAERLRRLHPPTADATGRPRQDRTQDPSPSQTSAPAPAEQPTRTVPGVNHPISQGPSRGDPTPGAEPEPGGTSAETSTPRPREDPRPATGNDQRRHRGGIRCHSHRPAPSEPISINLPTNAKLTAIPPRRNMQRRRGQHRGCRRRLPDDSARIPHITSAAGGAYTTRVGRSASRPDAIASLRAAAMNNLSSAETNIRSSATA